MTEIRFLLELVCWRLSFIRASRGKPVVRQLKLPILGCAVALTAGCSVIGLNQTMPMRHSTSPTVTPSNTQALSPEFQTPKWELAVPDRHEIDVWVRRFSEDKQRSFQTQLDRARFYVVPVQQIFEEQGLPKDIVFVALVESGFSPTARSHASAVGMWQFISSTGKRFRLEQNEWVDERLHPFKSARAAADYLSFLYEMFGSWQLALAAYNAGENAVQGAQTKSGLKSFWELAEGGYLPSETCDYVSKVLATIKIIRNPQHYGFHFDPKYYVKWARSVLCLLRENKTEFVRDQDARLCRKTHTIDRTCCTPDSRNKAIRDLMDVSLLPWRRGSENLEGRQELELAVVLSCGSPQNVQVRIC